MSRSIVVFGPASVGKSTLMGYLVAKLHPDQERIKKILNKNMQEFWYKEDQKFAYLFDRAIDERDEKHVSRKEKSHKGIGTTKYAEASTLLLNNEHITVLDTPGAEHRSKEREQGIFLGEIGIFALECPKGVESNQNDFVNSKQIYYLSIWSSIFQKKTRPIVVLTKMDLSEFSENDYKESVRRIHRATSDSKITVVPIAINVKSEYDHNVLVQSEKMDWYKKPTLWEYLQEAIKDARQKETEQSLLVSMFHTERNVTFPGTGRIWRCKILQGVLNKDEIIKIAPCEYMGEIVSSIQARVRNIRGEQSFIDTDKGLSGQIVGIDLADIRVRGKGISKNDIRILGSSIIIKPEQDYQYGNIVQLELKEEDIERSSDHGEAIILWYGYFITTRILFKALHNGKGILVVQIDNGSVAGPLSSSEKLVPPNFMIKIRENEGTNFTLISGKLECIGEEVIIRLLLDNTIVSKQTIIQFFGSTNYVYTDQMIVFNETTSTQDILRRIESLAEKLGVEDYRNVVEVDVVPKIMV